MMIPFLALIRKDLRIFFQDRRAVIMAFAAPIMIGSFFGYVFGGQSRSNNGAQGKTSVLVVDQEKDMISGLILESMRAEPMLQIRETTIEDAQDQIRKGKASVGVVIPAGFGPQAGLALSGQAERPSLTFFEDPSRTMEAKMIQGMLMGQIVRALGRGNGMAAPFKAVEQQLTARTDATYNPYAHSFGGMAIQFILFLGIDVGVGMLLDRQRGLWKRFASSPLSKWTLLGSRIVSATIIVMLILAVVFTFARIAFGVKMQGSLIGFAAICMAFGLMTSTYGLVIASIGKTPQGARGLSILATLLMVMLSGAWIPSFLFPKWLQDATKLIPARWAMDGLDAMSWRGLGIQEAILPVVILIGFAAAFGTFAALRFRWEEN